jgi:hypothetical protein
MLAIVIPFYKLAFFNQTLLSLATQTNKQFKVYIGDDASPDDCTMLLQKYNGKFEFYYKRFKTNLGGTSLTQQWERCINLINDDNIKWLMILGDDDVLSENVVEEFYKNNEVVKEDQINVIRYASVKIDSKNIPISTVYKHPKIELITDFIFRKNTRSSLSEYVFKKEIVLKKKFRELPLAWYADVMALFDFSNFGNIYTINNATVSVRYSYINISGKTDNNLEKNKATRKWALFLLENKNHFRNQNQILDKIEKLYVYDKKNFNLFIKIIKYHLFNFNIKKIFKFVTLIFKNTFNNYKKN